MPRPICHLPHMSQRLRSIALGLALAVPLAAGAEGQAPAAALASAPVQTGGTLPATAFDGVVEALRQSVVAAQVSGAVVQLNVKAGDRVKAGQVLLRLDARTADQSAAASNAQVAAARAALDVASKEYERQKRLAETRFISAAALDRAEAEFKATQAQVTAQLAGAGVARTQTGLHVVSAPYAGVVAEVPVALGDMATPGKPLLTLFDPAALRVAGAVPQSVVGSGTPNVGIEIPALAGAARRLTPTRVQVLPLADASTHTVTLRADLPANLAGVLPGQFARLWINTADAGASNAAKASLFVPASAVLRRAELTGVYVLGDGGKPLLRQVRLGRNEGERVEVLAGLMPGERVATDPQAAARVR